MEVTSMDLGQFSWDEDLPFSPGWLLSEVEDPDFERSGSTGSISCENDSDDTDDFSQHSQQESPSPPLSRSEIATLLLEKLDCASYEDPFSHTEEKLDLTIFERLPDVDENQDNNVNFTSATTLRNSLQFDKIKRNQQQFGFVGNQNRQSFRQELQQATPKLNSNQYDILQELDSFLQPNPGTSIATPPASPTATWGKHGPSYMQNSATASQKYQNPYVNLDQQPADMISAILCHTPPSSPPHAIASGVEYMSLSPNTLPQQRSASFVPDVHYTQISTSKRFTRKLDGSPDASTGADQRFSYADLFSSPSMEDEQQSPEPVFQTIDESGIDLGLYKQVFCKAPMPGLVEVDTHQQQAKLMSFPSSSSSSCSSVSYQEDPSHCDFLSEGDWNPSPVGECQPKKAFQPRRAGRAKVYGARFAGMKRQRGSAVGQDRTAVEERRLRKKEQNKNAATRYRIKKKVESEEFTRRHEDLEGVNIVLKQKAGSLENEVKYLKKLLKEILVAKGVIPGKK